MRLRLQITGLVQGVGFRPFVFRLAEDAGLKGYVLNDSTGVLIEVEGESRKLDEFLVRIEREKPGHSMIYSLQHTFIEESGYTEFRIRQSSDNGDKRAPVLPDITVCDECLREITDPEERRFLYPFANCTNCGPRFTIIESLPYDRENTSMRGFRMCPECEREYRSASDRRFHAQPNACHACGPWISLFDCNGSLMCEKQDALQETVNLLRKGKIVAVKGIGGYHLVCDATNEDAVRRLREKKEREERPMAVMFPDMDYIRTETIITEPEARAISSVERPIVIVRKSGDTTIATAVSPDNLTVGVFLPCTPLHHLILRGLKRPVVATSANITDDPIVRDETDAFARLQGIADFILAHNREIVRRCDDSVVRISAGKQMTVRRSRGYAPVPIIVPFSFERPVLALGGQMNCTVAVGIENRVFLSQHIGDIGTVPAMDFYEESVNDLLKLLDLKPGVVVSDMHPGYYSTRFGQKHFNSRLVRIQHHFAHILSCMAENDMPDDAVVIGFAFDGTGYGPDKTIWGGEVLLASYRGFERAYHLRPFRLPGGDKAIKEPCRTALSLLYETFGDDAEVIGSIPLTREERSFFINMIKKDINSPLTTSMGRLFDAVASMTGLRHQVSYHAQAAIELEQLAAGSNETGSYPVGIKKGIIDQLPMIEMIINDIREEIPRPAIAKKFHNTIEKIIIFSAELLRKETGISHVALSGGVFQNAILLENICHGLRERGFSPLVHQLVPPNDGGISLGQAVYTRFLMRKS